MLTDEELDRVLNECDDQARSGGYEPFECSAGEGTCPACGHADMVWECYVRDGDEADPEWVEAAICEACGRVTWRADV